MVTPPPGANVLERVLRFRKAARVVVRAEVEDVRRQYLTLIELADLARQEPDPLVRTWSERAIWEESKRFLGVDDEEHEQLPPEPYERAQRKLRTRGYSSCPTCLSVVATEADFERWHHMRADHIAELRRREEAVR
jgi:hypothetical protein